MERQEKKERKKKNTDKNRISLVSSSLRRRVTRDEYTCKRIEDTVIIIRLYIHLPRVYLYIYTFFKGFLI